jgi:DNA mismatch endonuclease (patch repair protein)
MSAIRSKHTKPEILVRRILSSLGYRYRLHSKKIPGKPDIVLSRLRKVIFVHGCFWHRHTCRYGKVKPQTNAEFWEKKLASNIARDHKNRALLRGENWKYLVIWECQTKTPAKLLNTISRFLDKPVIPTKSSKAAVGD